MSHFHGDGNDPLLFHHQHAVGIENDPGPVRPALYNPGFKAGKKGGIHPDDGLPAVIEAQLPGDQPVRRTSVIIVFDLPGGEMSLLPPFFQGFLPIAEVDHRHMVEGLILKDGAHVFAKIHRGSLLT